MRGGGILHNHVAQESRILQHCWRKFADNALEAGTRIMHVGVIRHHVGLAQRQSAGRLFQVDAASNASLHFLLNLLKHRAMGDVIILGERKEPAMPQHVVISACRLERGIFRSVQQLVVAGQLRVGQAADFVTHGRSVIQHLRQR
ncbi:MAG: hypothetical protein A3F73_13275 [Gallionellales bacterium RIFCSPLOWO2_12_FULL_59_22]|nr:MAG: hypothetical protein A3F73_13275 [Gallionellales bacterium RIFCSPLOWO2_12_FULL_59_22]